MSCKKIKEEFIVLFGEDAAGQDLMLAIRRHVSICPRCAEKAEHTRKIVTIVRERCSRESAPGELRERILARLRIKGSS